MDILPPLPASFFYPSNGRPVIYIDPEFPSGGPTDWEFFVDTGLSEEYKCNRALYLGADNRAAGRQAGELIKQALPPGGKIMVFVGKREVQNAQERYGPAILQALRPENKLGKIKIVCFDDEPETLAAIKDGPSFGQWRSSPSNTVTKRFSWRPRSSEATVR
jgi:ABC-type sugar transport system substrate-binding protein